MVDNEGDFKVDDGNFVQRGDWVVKHKDGRCERMASSTFNEAYQICSEEIFKGIA